MKKNKIYIFTITLSSFFLLIMLGCENPTNQAVITTATTINDITSTTAVAGGTITDDKGQTVIARGVCWSTDIDPTIKDSLTKDGSGVGSFVSELKNLLPNTSYYLRAYATNASGTAYGSTVNFTTIPEFATLITTPISSITTSSAIGGGIISDDGNSAITTRGVCWSLSPNPTTINSKTEDGNGKGEFISTITNLTQGFTYYLRAYATNALGTSYGNQVVFKTINPFPIDGIYISGDATTFPNDKEGAGMMRIAKNEVTQSSRNGLYEIYIPLEANKDFTITEYSGIKKSSYGPSNDFVTINQIAANDEMGASIQKGHFTQGVNFRVPTNGMYHIVIDKETSTVVIMPVTKWAIIGNSTPLGWSDNDMPLKQAFSKDSLIYEIKGISLGEGYYKFRHSSAWKQTIVSNPLIKVCTYTGGTNENLVYGGSDIRLLNENRGIYDIAIIWGKTIGLKYKIVKTGDLPYYEDPSKFVYSLIGSGFFNANFGAWVYDLDFTYNAASSTITNAVTKAGIYNFKITNVKLLSGNEFKIRKGHDWAVSYGYNAGNISVNAANFRDNGGNFYVITGITYSSIEFILTWPANTWVIKFNN